MGRKVSVPGAGLTRKAGLPAGRITRDRMKFKRFTFILIFFSIPLVQADPISIIQQTKTVSHLLVNEIPREPKPIAPKSKARYGVASWYSETDPYINIHTANNEVFDDTAMTCASWDYPFHTRLKVTNLDNGKSVVCRVNDRGPAKRLNRIIDLTKSAFEKIASSRLGLIQVSIQKIN